MGKSTISMAIFYSYVKLPEGNWGRHHLVPKCFHPIFWPPLQQGETRTCTMVKLLGLAPSRVRVATKNPWPISRNQVAAKIELSKIWKLWHSYQVRIGLMSKFSTKIHPSASECVRFRVVFSSAQWPLAARSKRSKAPSPAARPSDRRAHSSSIRAEVRLGLGQPPRLRTSNKQLPNSPWQSFPSLSRSNSSRHSRADGNGIRPKKTDQRRAKAKKNATFEP